MKYSTLPAFDHDFKDLAKEHRKLFFDVLPAFIAAAEQHATDPGVPWPRKLRVRPMKGAAGVWEMTWSFTGPDGRATFDWIEIDGEPAVRWRRIGTHAIYEAP